VEAAATGVAAVETVVVVATEVVAEAAAIMVAVGTTETVTVFNSRPDLH